MMVDVRGVTVKYGKTLVLDNVSVKVSAGDYVGIVGPNGSGKTTLIKAILGLVSCQQGAIHIQGKSRKAFHAWQQVGYLPQRHYMARQGFPATVREIVASGLLSGKRFPRRIPRSDRETVDRALRLFQIEDLAEDMIGQLSGGQLQRVLLSRALINEPDLLILDEPTVALDPATREQFYRVLQKMNQEKGATLLLVTHDSHTIGEYASRLLYLDRKVVFYGLFQDFCRSREMTRYFGEFAQHQICHQHHGRSGG